MGTLTPKQKEIEDREGKILEIAREMVAHGGYHGLNMDSIARSLQYSKGTIYNHFPCKEEIIIALTIQTMEIRMQLFNRAAAFQGCSRERMLAVGVGAELFVRLYPEHFMVEQIIRINSILEKTSEKRRLLMHSCETRCVATVAGIVRDAIAGGDLTLAENFTPEDLVFGLWSLTSGAYSIIATSDSLDQLGIADPFEAVRAGIAAMLDGHGWKPLRDELDLSHVLARIQSEVFSDEFKSIENGAV